MSLTDAIETTEIKEKLRNLEQCMPKATEFYCHIGKYLADRLNDHLNPNGFANAFEWMIIDLHSGKSSVYGKQIPTSLVGYPTVVYAALLLDIPTFAEKVCPSDFAREVREFREEVRIRNQKKS